MVSQPVPNGICFAVLERWRHGYRSATRAYYLVEKRAGGAVLAGAAVGRASEA